MIVCPNCNHQNPDGAAQCEACYTPLPATTACPNCGAPVQTDATFCGQCGSNLRPSSPGEVGASTGLDPFPSVPDLMAPEPLVAPDPLVASPQPSMPSSSPDVPAPVAPVPATVVSQSPAQEEQASVSPPPAAASSSSTPPAPAATSSASSKTQLQQQNARLLHVQTDTMIELPAQLSVIHIGKPNDQIPPDIDVSGFPNSEIVSRIHADIRVEGDAFYIEDVGSANGTYINHNPLASGNRHRLRTGDRIGLGKGDKMTFLFQLS